MTLGEDVKITLGLAYVSGTAVREGAILDMAGWDGVLIIMVTATIAASAVGDLHAEEDDASGGGTMADLLGTAMATAAADDDKMFVLDIYRPLKRYIRGVVTKDTSNAAAETVIYIQYHGRKRPVADMGADNYERHLSPIAGTK